MIINPIVRNERGEGADIFSKNLESRIIHLVGEIDDVMAASIIAQLLQLDAESQEDIYLYINSPGGSVSAGLAIYDTMQHLKSEVSTICVGMSASMGAVILSGGAKGKRVILKHSEVMIHQPSTGMAGQASEIEIAATHIAKCKKTLATIVSENCGKSLEQVTEDMDRDHWMDSKEALEYGIVDSILD